MRRQARISGGGTLGVRSASALQVWLWLLIFIFQNEFRISRSIQPGYLDFDNLPETNFTCAGKVIGGYYADLEASCQMFHVCTVGQQDEPMDIKFLCLNGTVFDQETRVCERVDEVDCTKSEKFYSLNLELYGSTAPPIIQSDQTKPEPRPTEHTAQHTKPSPGAESDPSLDDSSTTDKIRDHHTEVVDSTEDPVQDMKKDDRKQVPTPPPTHQLLPALDDEEAEYEDEEYEEDYQSPTTTTTAQTTTKTTTTSSTTKAPPTTISPPPTSSHHYPAVHHHFVSSPSPTVSSIPSPTLSSSASPASSLPSLNQALLTPQEFIYRHRGPGSEAISFQRQSFRPADGVFITHAPPQQQYDHFQYESSRTAPRPALPRPAPFVQRPQPAPFRPTTNDPRDQLLRPGPTSQPSERHETSIKHRPQQYPPILPPQRPLPFNPYYYDRKRSDDSHSENESSLTARSVAPPTVTERPPTKPKSPPRVIVTASASVSDSNGKKLNYTVGNVVSAVKPIVPINYDDYKESDLIFDPFFLDVPKLQKRRKSRSYRRNRKIITISPSTTTTTTTTTTTNKFTEKEPEKNIKVSTSTPVVSQTTTTSGESSTTTTSTTTVAWNPDDYVDDNYEPHAYQPPAPPHAVVVAYDYKKLKKQENPSSSTLNTSDLKSHIARVVHIKRPRPTSSAAQTTSSQMEAAAAAAPAPTPPLLPPPVQALSCATSHSHDCRTRA